MFSDGLSQICSDCGGNASQGYLNNPKLWVKFICVAVLTANGYLAHLLVRASC